MERKKRSNSLRLDNWNYSNTGAYFVTICTDKRRPYLATIENGEVKPTKIGQEFRNQWKKSADLRSNENIDMEQLCIMPDHIHGIIHIHSKENEAAPNLYNYKNSFGPQSRNLPSLIRGLKSALTSWSKDRNLEFGWQRGYYDRIIRSEAELNRIIDYIQNNPIILEECLKSNSLFDNVSLDKDRS